MYELLAAGNDWKRLSLLPALGGVCLGDPDEQRELLGLWFVV